MTRTLVISLFAIGLFGAGCTSTNTDSRAAGGNAGGKGGAAGGGASGTARGGASGSSAGAGGGATIATGGGAGASTAGAGGLSASGGASGTGGATVSDGGQVDSPAADVNSGGGLDAGSSRDLPGIEGHEWVIPCPADYTHAQCCAHYCSCMTTNCPDRAPKDCVTTCTAPGNTWRLLCRLEQCFESLNPGYPQDKGSHCGHAVEQGLKCQGIIPGE